MFQGIDIGSTTTKIVKMDGNSLIKQIIPTIKFIYSTEKDYFNAVSTGYGRFTIKSSKVIPEIRAHVLGALFQTELRDFTLLDIGGQDYKIVHVVNGVIQDFLTNDKCAAGTGRFLEKMAQVLDVTIDEISKHYRDPVKLNSTCTVFAETELISRMMEGYPKESLMAGVNYSVFERIRPFLLRFKSPTIVFTGGVAKNGAIVEVIRQELGKEVVVPGDPQANGAIGCAYYAKKLNLRSQHHISL
ncbi:MAG TPA: 2-hydroxyglutaryl-CoA dehydratase [Euryarchaeota archaeon]|nr:2-hydroxyglutaryl-CoA dehydratase [Euryarchaeota archaeon]